MSSESEKICNITDAAKISSLSADALVTCGRCGAKAHDPANVCDPVQYPEAGVLGD
ncbi:MAG: hypothetical protein HYV06_01955 [Deltaproteobacteria bacterium]|nr:hypothetical protein [Deltaproteobacteria bacterium]